MAGQMWERVLDILSRISIIQTQVYTQYLMGIYTGSGAILNTPLSSSIEVKLTVLRVK